MQLYFDITDSSGLISVNTSDSHSAQSATSTFEVTNTNLEIGDFVEINLGYVGNYSKAFSGYVKNIELREPKKSYTITASNVLVRAMDFFIASSTPENPFTRSSIKAETLVGDVLALAGLTSYVGDNTLFTFGIINPVEVNLTTSYDYARFIGDILAYNVYADMNGVVHFTRRLPYVVPGDTSIGTINEQDCLTFSYTKTDRELRNRVVVYGAAGITAEASSSSPYLPDGFYKSVVVAAPTVFDNIGMAQQSADYNLELLNRLTESLHITMPGNSIYQPRSVVTVSSIKYELSGDWYIFTAGHTLDSSGYTTTLELRR
jgi:hypothetical protein